MKPNAKNKTQPSKDRGIKRSTEIGAKSSRSVGVRMKNQEKTEMNRMRPTRIEQEYVRLFTVPETPHDCFYSEDYDLKQPSALKYVPSTTEPNAEV
jgi:hypothetical protein